MITKRGQYFLLSSLHTSLLLYVNEIGKVCCEYYGKKITDKTDFSSLSRRHNFGIGTSVLADESVSSSLSNDFSKEEYSTPLIGGYNYPSLILSGDKTAVFDFRYESDSIRKPVPLASLPTPHDADQELVITCLDKPSFVQIRLHYLVYEKDDVVARYVEIINSDIPSLSIEKAASYELTLANHGDRFFSNYGSWANEGNREEGTIIHGRLCFNSDSGSSGNRHNPFFMVQERGGSRFYGSTYAFNLVYSGNHEESLELDTYGNLHIEAGISSLCFKKKLAPHESFVTPLGIMSYSEKGISGVSLSMQHFVKDCVIRKEWVNKPRPIVYNTWEATCFDFTKRKIVSLMKKAASLGIELFVLDDGWFGDRNDDSHGLGDWTCNEKKIPGGLASLASQANELGLQFGIWMEPEMVNPQSQLYKNHPDWVISDGVHKPLLGRHQLTLDLTKKEVRDYLVTSVSNVLSSANISYLKWDMNRPMSDVPFKDGFSSFYYDYTIGLYDVLSQITEKFPNVLLENCASGGNRFDLGMLSYFPQSWMSDDTDSYQRSLIQSGLCLGYPLCVSSNHVAAKTSNQLLRLTSLDTKFDVACFGILGYELDLNDLTPVDEKTIKRQIAYYKSHRVLAQQGDFILLSDYQDGELASFEDLGKDEALVGHFKRIATMTPEEGRLVVKGLSQEGVYTYETRQEGLSFHKFGNLINYVSPIHLSPDGALLTLIANRHEMKSEIDSGQTEGSALEENGAILSEEWMGLGFNEKTRLMGDFGARLYYIKKE